MGTDLLTETPHRSNGWIGCVGEAVTSSVGYTDQSYTTGIVQEYAAVIPTRPRAIAVTQSKERVRIKAVTVAELPVSPPATVVEVAPLQATAPEPAKWWQLEER